MSPPPHHHPLQWCLMMMMTLAALTTTPTTAAPQYTPRGRPQISLTPQKSYSPESNSGVTKVNPDSGAGGYAGVPPEVLGYQSLGVNGGQQNTPSKNTAFSSPGYSDSNSGYKEFNAFSASNRGGQGSGGYQPFNGGSGGSGASGGSSSGYAVSGGIDFNALGHAKQQPRPAQHQQPFNARKPSGPPPGYEDPAFPQQPHNFGYTVHDPHFGDSHRHQEVSDGTTTTGEYRVVLPDGRTQIVTYSAAADTGFKAEVTYQGEARPYVAPEGSTTGGQTYSSGSGGNSGGGGFNSGGSGSGGTKGHISNGAYSGSAAYSGGSSVGYV